MVDKDEMIFNLYLYLSDEMFKRGNDVTTTIEERDVFNKVTDYIENQYDYSKLPHMKIYNITDD